ncbi:hypothetical protein BGW80DRAFT_1541473 [Lactifluus volemus]|nr:hypothetical protein BGW80DRAFT_1541473 [Lactifluus volemus]
MASSHIMTPEFPFSIWSDTFPAEDYTAEWSDFTNDAQLSVVQDPFLDNLDVHSGNAINSVATFSNVGAVKAAAAYAPPPPTSEIYLEDLVDNNFHQDPCSLWLAPTPSLTDSSSVPSPSGDSPWAENLASPTYPTPGVFTDPLPSGSVTGPTFQPELPWHEKSGQFDYVTPQFFVGDSNWDGETAPAYSAGFLDHTDIEGYPSYPLEWSLQGPTLNGPGEALALPTPSPAQKMAVPGTVLGKRPHRDDDNYDDEGLGQGQDGCERGSGGSGSHKGARIKPATRTSANRNDKSKTVGRGAGRLATTTAEGVYHQSLPGPSDQQVLVGTTALGQLTWVEESVEGGSWHHSSVVRKEVEVQSTEPDRDGENATDELFWIPRRLDARHQALLVAKPADWQRKAVDELKCRLCPGADFSDWEDYKRHCDTSEAHPAKISYCGHCGDFFARSDALKRHREKRPLECICTTAEVAEVKRTETARVFEEFKAELERCLTTDEEIPPSFARTIKDMFPDSSKRGSREQSRKRKSRAGR